MKKQILAAIVLLFVGWCAGQSKHGFMVWRATQGHDCLKVEIGKNTEFVAPLKDDGTPDIQHGVLNNVIATIGTSQDKNKSCGAVELR